MSSPVQEQTAGRPDADAVGIDPVGPAAQGLDALPDAVRALLAGGAR